MTSFTQKFSTPFLSAFIRNVMLALFLVILGASAALAQTKAYVTNNADNTVSVIDTTSNAVIATLPVGSGPRGIAVTPNNAFAYVANEFDEIVSVIDTATNTVTATIPVGPAPGFVAITPNGSFAYVTPFIGSDVWVIDTATNTVVATLSPGGLAVGIDVAPNGAFAYVANSGSDNIAVLDTATNTVTATIPVGNNPEFIAMTKTPPDQITPLINQVEALFAGGSLTQTKEMR